MAKYAGEDLTYSSFLWDTGGFQRHLKCGSVFVDTVVTHFLIQPSMNNQMEDDVSSYLVTVGEHSAAPEPISQYIYWSVLWGLQAHVLLTCISGRLSFSSRAVRCTYSTFTLWPQRLVLYVCTNNTGLLHSSFQADIGLSRQPEYLILDNKISLSFKSCQIPLQSRPPNNVDMLQWRETYHKSERPGMSLFFPLKYGSKSWVLSLWA